MRILLVEPDQILAKVYTAACLKNNKNAEIVSVSSIEDAIVAADNQQPDLIICELLLARHNGVEFLYELRSYTDLKSIPVIILSWVPEQEFYSTIDAGLLGVHAYLYKPTTTLSHLISVVQKVTIEAKLR